MNNISKSYKIIKTLLYLVFFGLSINLDARLRGKLERRRGAVKEESRICFMGFPVPFTGLNSAKYVEQLHKKLVWLYYFQMNSDNINWEKATENLMRILSPTFAKNKEDFSEIGELEVYSDDLELRIERPIETSMEDDRYTTLKALYLLTEFVRKGHSFAEATQCASFAVLSDDVLVQRSALTLFRALVEKGQAFEQAIEVAVTVTRNDDVLVQRSALTLFRALVEKGQAFEQAIKVAVTGTRNDDVLVQRFALTLFRALVEKGQAFGEAVEAAKVLIQSDDKVIRSKVTKLLDIIEQNILSGDYLVNSDFIEVLDNIADDGFLFKWIRFLCVSILSSDRFNLNEEVQREISNLLKKLGSCSYMKKLVQLILKRCSSRNYLCKRMSSI
jgi:hypothetical protein